MKVTSKSQSKKIKFEENNNCLFGGEYQKKYVTYVIRSINLEMYLQNVRITTLSASDEKQSFLNGSESIPFERSLFHNLYFKRILMI